MDRNEKALELMERAEDLGMPLEFDSGLVVVKRTKTDDPEGQRAIIEGLGRYLSEVRQLVEKRAIAARGKSFLGQRVWSPEYRVGVLVNASTDGSLLCRFENAAFPNPQTLTHSAETLLLVVDEEADGASSPQNDKPAVAQPRRGIFERLLGS